jgi:hypothetical protein
MGDQQHCTVPLRGTGDHESRALNFAVLELEVR